MLPVALPKVMLEDAAVPILTVAAVTVAISTVVSLDAFNVVALGRTILVVLRLIVPVSAPISTVVAVPKAFTVVAMVSKRLTVRTPVFDLIVAAPPVSPRTVAESWPPRFIVEAPPVAMFTIPVVVLLAILRVPVVRLAKRFTIPVAISAVMLASPAEVLASLKIFPETAPPTVTVVASVADVPRKMLLFLRAIEPEPSSEPMLIAVVDPTRPLVPILIVLVNVFSVAPVFIFVVEALLTPSYPILRVSATPKALTVVATVSKTFTIVPVDAKVFALAPLPIVTVAPAPPMLTEVTTELNIFAVVALSVVRLMVPSMVLAILRVLFEMSPPTVTVVALAVDVPKLML